MTVLPSTVRLLSSTACIASRIAASVIILPPVNTVELESVQVYEFQLRQPLQYCQRRTQTSQANNKNHKYRGKPHVLHWRKEALGRWEVKIFSCNGIESALTSPLSMAKTAGQASSSIVALVFQNIAGGLSFFDVFRSRGELPRGGEFALRKRPAAC